MQRALDVLLLPNHVWGKAVERRKGNLWEMIQQNHFFILNEKEIENIKKMGYGKFRKGLNHNGNGGDVE